MSGLPNSYQSGHAHRWIAAGKDIFTSDKEQIGKGKATTGTQYVGSICIKFPTESNRIHCFLNKRRLELCQS